MKVIIFGATGMVGQGVLGECLKNPEITEVTTIGRTPSEIQHPKLKNLLHADLFHYESIEGQLTGFDAAYFCLGTPSAGKNEDEYTHITYDLTLAAATTLARLNPEMTFIYISGEGADSTEKGSAMWGRVRGKTENALFRLPFKKVYVFRPGMIRPMNGIQSKTRLYRVIYRILDPVFPMLEKLFPNGMTTTDKLGRAMISISQKNLDQKIFKTADLNRYGA